MQAGFYVQDDIRVRKNLSLTPGLRYEVQSHVSDHTNVGPRFGFTWAPAANGQTALSPNYDAPRTTRFSTGIDQAIRKVTRVSLTYSYTRGARLARGLNVNR